MNFNSSRYLTRRCAQTSAIAGGWNNPTFSLGAVSDSVHNAPREQLSESLKMVMFQPLGISQQPESTYNRMHSNTLKVYLHTHPKWTRDVLCLVPKARPPMAPNGSHLPIYFLSRTWNYNSTKLANTEYRGLIVYYKGQFSTISIKICIKPHEP